MQISHSRRHSTEANEEEIKLHSFLEIINGTASLEENNMFFKKLLFFYD